MGYYVSFEGRIEFSPPLSEAQAGELNAVLESRLCAAGFLSPEQETSAAFGGPTPKGFNDPAPGWPGLHCPARVGADRASLAFVDSKASGDEAEIWLAKAIDEIEARFGPRESFSGVVFWQGEELEDRGSFSPSRFESSQGASWTVSSVVGACSPNPAFNASAASEFFDDPALPPAEADSRAAKPSVFSRIAEGFAGLFKSGPGSAEDGPKSSASGFAEAKRDEALRKVCSAALCHSAWRDDFKSWIQNYDLAGLRFSGSFQIPLRGSRATFDVQAATLLHVAVAFSNAELYSAALACGADPLARDGAGRTPSEVPDRFFPATSSGARESAEALAMTTESAARMARARPKS